MSEPYCIFDQYFMKTQKTKKVAGRSAAKNNKINVNLDCVLQIADESISTIMAMRALIVMLVAEKEGRKDAR